MIFSDYYNRIRDGVLRENLNGTYIKRRPSNCVKKILALSIVSLGTAFCALYSLIYVHTTDIPYVDDLKTRVYLPKGTSYLYINIDGLYQNYLSYSKSISYSQLKGKTENLKLKSTEPFDYNGKLPYYPAGAIAATYYQDEISIDGLEIETSGISRNTGIIGYTSYFPDEISIPINWTASTNKRATPLNTFKQSGLPILDERFVNWVTLSAFSNFKKLWGKIEITESGNYDVVIKSRNSPGEKKSVFIAEKSILGVPDTSRVVGLFVIFFFTFAVSIYLSKYGY